MSTGSNQNEGLRILEEVSCQAISDPFVLALTGGSSGGVASQEPKPAQTFQNDADYQHWLAEHPDGFVVNTNRTPSPNYMVLHRATCRHISDPIHEAEPGGFTERQYVKVAAIDVAALREWATAHGRQDGSFSSECTRCRPTG